MPEVVLSGRVGARFYAEVADEPKIIETIRAGAGLGWKVLSETDISKDPRVHRWIFWIQSDDAPIEAEGQTVCPAIGRRDDGSFFVSSWGIPSRAIA